MKHILGISAGFHDAAVSVINDQGDILFAAQSERYSKIKNDRELNLSLLDECNQWEYDTISYYERPWRHQLLQLLSRQELTGYLTTKKTIKQCLTPWLRYDPKKFQSFGHHLSHAAAGFQTSSFDEAAVVVIDAIGELDTITIYHASYDKDGRAQYRRLWHQRYPHSIGLFYTAITARLGLIPMEDEYITMGMSAYGDHTKTITQIQKKLIADDYNILFRENLHIGLPNNLLKYSNEDLAAGAQFVTEKLIRAIMHRAKKITNSKNLVYMGGVALNCLANRFLGDYFEKFWIMPNPGDAGSSLGAAALSFGGRLNWNNCFLGHNISGDYPSIRAVEILKAEKIVGVASGRAEFGPRALGNRSLLADPRDDKIKDRVNDIKRRQKYRPFAPIILEEEVNNYFDMPKGWESSPYMQTVARCKFPNKFPAIVHVDNTSRVQTVSKNSNIGIRKLLEKWYQDTGCPMLLNTSLNVRGEPIVNNKIDAERFQLMYNVKVCS